MLHADPESVSGTLNQCISRKLVNSNMHYMQYISIAAITHMCYKSSMVVQHNKPLEHYLALVKLLVGTGEGPMLSVSGNAASLPCQLIC